MFQLQAFDVEELQKDLELAEDYLVFVSKRLFSPISSSNFTVPCASYTGTTPRNCSFSLTLSKISHFDFKNPPFLFSSFDTGTIYDLEQRLDLTAVEAIDIAVKMQTNFSEVHSLKLVKENLDPQHFFACKAITG